MWQIRTMSNNIKPAPIFVVGTHVDQLKKTYDDLIYTEQQIRKQFPQQRFGGLRGVFFVSCRTGSGVQELKDAIHDSVIKFNILPNVKPSWLRLWDLLEDKSFFTRITKHPYIKWTEFSNWAILCSVPENEIKDCVEFLQETGRIVPLYEPDDIDQGLVILDPLWLATLMGNFLTFKHTWIKKGILHEAHIKQVFIDYPEDTHLPLINMLKKFNILYPLQGNNSNDVKDECSFIIPSMLPPNLSEGDIMKFWVVPFAMETSRSYGRNYLFSFLPHGLISRLIVRLLHFPSTVGLSFGKNGAILENNNQTAMIQYSPPHYKLSILIRVHESNPSDSFFRLILDTTDSLLEDSFQMKKAYRRTIPCIHCLKNCGVQTTTKDELPFEFTYRECISAITSKRTSLFCNHIHSSSREVRIADLAPDISFADIHILKSNDIIIGNLLAKGAFGVVYEGILSYNNQPIAIKELSFTSKSSNLEDLFSSFQQEVHIMSKLQHINLVQLIGVSLYPNIQIILEFLEKGNLFSFLHPPNNNDINNYQRENGNIISYISKKEFPWSLRLKIAKDIASGMNYLQSQSPAIIHRDLRSPNIFLASLSENAPVRAKVADFGLSRFVAQVAEGTLNTWEWMAPETLEKGQYTLSADVYSFGIVCWEIASRCYPFDEYYSDKKFIGSDGIPLNPLKMKYSIIHEGLRPSLSLADIHAPQEFLQIIEKCFHSDPNQRPTFSKILEELTNLVEDYPCEIDLYENDIKKKSNNIIINSNNNLLNEYNDLSSSSFIPITPTAIINQQNNENSWNNAYVEDYKLKGKIKLEKYPATCICLVGSKLWIGCRDGTILISGANLKSFEHRWKAHDFSIATILFVGKYVWTTAVGGCVRVWSRDDYNEIQEFYPYRDEESVIKSMIITTSNSISRIWAASPKQRQLYIWDTETLDLIHYLPLPKNTEISILTFCNIEIDNNNIDVVLAGDGKGEIHIILVETLQFYASWSAHSGPISGIQQNTRSKEIWTTCKTSPDIKIWRITDEEMILEKSCSSQSNMGIHSIHLNPVANTICSISSNTIISWDLSSHKPTQELAEHEERIVAGYGSKDMIYSCDKAGNIFSWQKRVKFHTSKLKLKL